MHDLQSQMVNDVSAPSGIRLLQTAVNFIPTSSFKWIFMYKIALISIFYILFLVLNHDYIIYIDSSMLQH